MAPLIVGEHVVGTLNVPTSVVCFDVDAFRSAGVATTPDSRDDRERLVREADGYLMRAKREGRERVVLGEPAGA